MAIKQLNGTTCYKRTAPERVIQFGEGNFLRGFVDWIIEEMDRRTGFNASVVAIPGTPAGRTHEKLSRQDYLYHVNLQGLLNDKNVNIYSKIEVISRIVSPFTDFDEYLKLGELPDVRFVLSNTTEAGIVFDSKCKFNDRPASTFPGKLTQLLFRRYKTFGGDPAKGLIILPCELIFENGRELRNCINAYIELWRDDLGVDYAGFDEWVNRHCHICNTLVDRIVSGFPASKISEINRTVGFDDRCLVQGEIYHLWVIECPQNMTVGELEREFPARQAGLNVLITDDEAPYHQRKVTLLNAPHTLLAPTAYLAGLDIVRDAVKHPVVGRYLRQVQLEELLPTLSMPQDELRQYAGGVTERFCNPYIDHSLRSIMLNAFSKYNARVVPALKRYVELRGRLPEGMVFGLAALVTYYKGGERADGQPVEPNDSAEIIEFMSNVWQLGDYHEMAAGILGEASLLWDGNGNLNSIPGLTEALAENLKMIADKGVLDSLKTLADGC